MIFNVWKNIYLIKQSKFSFMLKNLSVFMRKQIIVFGTERVFFLYTNSFQEEANNLVLL